MLVSELKNNIIDSLECQGFSVNGKVQPLKFNKNAYRKIHTQSKIEQLKLQKTFFEKSHDIVKQYFVKGIDINPAEIKLELRLVETGSEDEIVYRWWNLLWWSVPYQKAYGRQMRFLLWDTTHNAPFGIIGLQSPVLKMSVRDSYLKIPNGDLDLWINKSMQAQRLGALPPYNQLLGGKMVGLALTSNELRKAYKEKYQNVTTLMKKRKIEPDLLFITTTSAFGRSSIYNRLKFNNEPVAISLGYTQGSGTFHIPQDLYIEIQEYLKKRDVNIKTTFGNGPSRKIKLLDKAFGMLNLGNYTYHNIQREFFLFPLAKNINNVIQKNVRPNYYSRKLYNLTDYWIERWCSPRSKRITDWQKFNGKKLSYYLKSKFMSKI